MSRSLSRRDAVPFCAGCVAWGTLWFLLVYFKPEPAPESAPSSNNEASSTEASCAPLDAPERQSCEVLVGCVNLQEKARREGMSLWCVYEPEGSP